MHKTNTHTTATCHISAVIVMLLQENIKNSISSLEKEQEKLAENIPITNAAEETYKREHASYEDLKKEASGKEDGREICGPLGEQMDREMLHYIIIQ